MFLWCISMSPPKALICSLKVLGIPQWVNILQLIYLLFFWGYSGGLQFFLRLRTLLLWMEHVSCVHVQGVLQGRGYKISSVSSKRHLERWNRKFQHIASSKVIRLCVCTCVHVRAPLKTTVPCKVYFFASCGTGWKPRCIYRSRIAGLWGTYVFSFIRCCLIALQSGWANLLPTFQTTIYLIKLFFLAI